MRRRCRRGKPCGESCISRGFYCDIELGQPVSPPLSQMRNRIKERPKGIPETRRKIDGVLNNMVNHYEGWVNLRKNDPLSSDSVKQQIREKERKIDEAKKKAIDMAKSLPAIERAEVMRQISSREAEAMKIYLDKKDVKSVIKSIASDIKERRRLNQSVDELENRISKIVPLIAKGREGQVLYPVARALGIVPEARIKPKENSFDGVSKIGSTVLANFRSFEKLSASLNELEKSHKKIEEELSRFSLVPGRKARLQRELREVERNMMSEYQKLAQGMQILRNEMLKTNLSMEQINEVLDGIKFFRGRGSADAKQVVTEFIAMFNGKGFLPIEGVSPSDVAPVRRISRAADRSEANTATGEIRLRAFSREAAFHEFAHMVEGLNTGLNRDLINWRDQRAFNRGEARNQIQPFVRPEGNIQSATRGQLPVFRLNQLDPARSFDNGELAVADKFISPYMGKVYKSGPTEVLSMAMEHFSNPSSMATFYRAHPDLFRLVVGLSFS